MSRVKTSTGGESSPSTAVLTPCDTDLGDRGDAIFVLLLPLECLVEIGSGGRRLYIGQHDIRVPQPAFA